MPSTPHRLPALFAAITGIAVLNGTRKLVDAAVPMSPEVAEQALLAYVAKSAPSDASARQAIAAAGGWLGCVRHLYGRMRAKALASTTLGKLPIPSVCHTLMEALAVLNRARIALPTDESLASDAAWIVAWARA